MQKFDRRMKKKLVSLADPFWKQVKYEQNFKFCKAVLGSVESIIISDAAQIVEEELGYTYLAQKIAKMFIHCIWSRIS